MVAARLGHADPLVTLQVYAHVIREQVAEAAEVFARSVQGSQKAGVSKSVSKKAPAEGQRPLTWARSEGLEPPTF